MDWDFELVAGPTVEPRKAQYGTVKPFCLPTSQTEESCAITRTPERSPHTGYHGISKFLAH